MLISKSTLQEGLESDQDLLDEMEPHTKAKHMILEEYIKAWLPILGSTKKHLVYIDGFAGPGKYKGDEDGSPKIALNAAIGQQVSRPEKITMIFIEKDKKYFKVLCQVIDEISKNIPDNITVRKFGEDFESAMTRMLNKRDKENTRLTPTLAFLDPFGYSVSMELVRRLLSYEKCEVLVTLMNNHMNRFLGETSDAI